MNADGAYLAPEARPAAAAAVRRRLVLFIHGFDPRGFGLPYANFLKEFDKHKRLTGAEGAVGPIEPSPPDKPWLKRWHATLAEPGEPPVETVFDFLQWQDLIPRRRRFRFAQMTWAAVTTFIAMLRYGVFPKMAAYSRSHCALAVVQFAIVALYLWIMASLVWTGYVLGRPYGGLYAALGVAAGLALAAGFYWMTVRLDRFLYVWFAIALWNFQWLHGSRGLPEVDRRFEHFGAYVEEKLADPDFDEVVLIAVSTGAYHSIEMLGGILQRNPTLGGRTLPFLTLGAQPSVTSWFGPRGRFLDGMKRILGGGAVQWLAYTIRGDIMTVDGYDPFREGHLDANELRGNAIIHHRIHLKHMLTPESRKALGWKFLWIHLYYLMASETGDEHDFFSLTCSSRPLLSESAAWRARALAARSG